MRKLYRSEKDKWIGGVLGGLGEYLGVDSTLLRLAFIVFCLATGGVPGIIGYILAVIIIPKPPASSQTLSSTATEGGSTPMTETASSQNPTRPNNPSMVVGFILVGLGILFLFNNFIDIHWHLFWPAVLIVIGLVLLGKALTGEKKG
ncbi:MAG TPA: PspC domain-containing protein [Verrucomicrobiae bacterium]|nr:PspC domain-containing protein [Verrucomicrobiae bacterium]